MRLNKLKNNRPKRRLSTYIGLALLSASSVGCVQAAETPKPTDAPSKAEMLTKANTGERKMPKRFTKDELVNTSRQDLAKRLDIDLKEINILSAAQVTWRSGALGCPKPGEVYTQALVPGVLIVLGAQSKHHRYHGKRHGLPSYCPNQNAESPAPSSNDI